MVKQVMSDLGPWRTPKTLEDAKQIANTVIDSMDPEWLLRSASILRAFPKSRRVVNDWVKGRRPPQGDTRLCDLNHW